KRYVIARTKDELIHAFMYFSELAHEPPIVQEYLPGSGYGCSVLAKRGEIIRSICHRRIREYPVSGGPSTCCDVISAPHLEAMAEQIARAIGLNGPAMFEFKDDADGHPRLLECNPRVWGSYPLTRVSKSGFSYAWFVLSYNAANPDALLPLPQRPEIMKRRMVFFPSDFAAAKGYLRSGNKKLALGAVADFLNPSVKDGLFEWRDMRPAFSYWRSLTKR
ncbi:MAG: ATP-grasp domain-containing protein, partial [Oscillospiraceae bacterium]|nr:ATP-grasp domain-containing protein [Oscillospiraceae bacterium]